MTQRHMAVMIPPQVKTLLIATGGGLLIDTAAGPLFLRDVL
jgi:hypothetical protein